MSDRAQTTFGHRAPRLKVSTLLALLASVWLVGAGCGVPTTAAPLPVRWGAIDPNEGALWIVPVGGQDLGSGELHLKRSSPLEVKLLLVNRTSTSLFVRHDVSRPLRYAEYRARALGPYGAKDLPIAWESIQGENFSYVLLEPAESLIPWPTGHLPRDPHTSGVYVEFVVTPPPATTSMDVSFRWLLQWFPVGAAEADYFDFQHALRVIYDDK